MRPTTIVWIAIVVLAVIAAGLVSRRQSDDAVPPVTTESTDSTPLEAVYMPAEFALQSTLLLGGSQLVTLFPEVLADIAQATAGAINLRILAGSTTAHAAIDSILASTGTTAEIIDLPIFSMWVRDFGPVTVSDARGHRHLVDFHYRERRGDKIDDDVPGHIARVLDLEIETSRLLVEGGDFLTNGRGFCLLSTRLINRNAHYLELEPRQTIDSLGMILGFDNLLLARPLKGESTGHVDMFAAFLAVDLVLVGQYNTRDDAENADRLDAVATNLAGRQTLSGPLRVKRIPMPDHDDGVWRTYTNVVFANGVLLVPIYPDYCPELDAAALATYRRLLPKIQVVGIRASKLIRMNGALRCITMNIPQGGLQVPGPG